jgi:GTP cyclohydrolase I
MLVHRQIRRVGSSRSPQRVLDLCETLTQQILNESPPKEGEESKEVQDHNQEVILWKDIFVRIGENEKLWKKN